MFETINLGYIIVPFVIGIMAYFPFCHLTESDYDSLTHLAWGLTAILIGIVINVLSMIIHGVT